MASDRLLLTPSSAEDLLELVSRRDFELIVAALLRRLIGSPALKHGRVSETIALQVVVLDLAHALDTKWLPGQIFPRTPSTLSARHSRRAASIKLGPFAPRMRRQRVLAQRFELLRQLLAPGHRERRGHA